QAECAELVTAFALSVSVAVDQLAAAQASVNPATANPAAATQAPRSDSATETRPPRTLDTQLAQPPPAKPKPKPQPAGPDIELRGSAHGALGLVPQVTAGALLGIAARTRIWS